ncbi:class I SAM-dependent methyltransferase [Spirosoma fluminis]
MEYKHPAGGNFDWVAPVYDALAFTVFGRRLQRAQTVYLNDIPPGLSVLIVGGGTGWLLEQLLVRCKPDRVVYLELSGPMVARASRRMLRKALPGTVDFRVGDETALRPDERFDLILTPFLLDLFEESTLRMQLIPRLQKSLASAGCWLVTDFVRPSAWWQKVLLWSMIRFFRLTAGIETRQLANWQHCLQVAGLILLRRQAQVGGMVSAEIWAYPEAQSELIASVTPSSGQAAR